MILESVFLNCVSLSRSNSVSFNEFLFLAVLGCCLETTFEPFDVFASANELKTSTFKEKRPALPGTVVETS